MNGTPEEREWKEACRRRVEEWVANPAGLPPTQAEILAALREQEQEDHNREWRRIRSPEYLAQEAERTARESERLEQERKKWAARQAELARQQQLRDKAEAERKAAEAAAEEAYRARAAREKADYEQWLRAQREEQDVAHEKKRQQQLKAAATHRRRQAERAAAEAKAQAERAALATDSLDNYSDEGGVPKYTEVGLPNLEKVTTVWEQRHALDEAEAGAYESAWWQRTDNQREHALERMAQQYLERLAGKPLYQCPWSKMRLIPGGNDMPHRGRRNLPKL